MLGAEAHAAMNESGEIAEDRIRNRMLRKQARYPRSHGCNCGKRRVVYSSRSTWRGCYAILSTRHRIRRQSKHPEWPAGRIVTVLVEESLQADPSGLVMPISSMTSAERERLKEEFLQRGKRIRSRLKDQLPIDYDSELYGDDGLPT